MLTDLAVGFLPESALQPGMRVIPEDRNLPRLRDAEIALTRYTVAHRVRALPAIRGTRLVGPAMHRRLAKRLEVKSLIVRLEGPTGVAVKRTVSPFRAFARWA